MASIKTINFRKFFENSCLKMHLNIIGRGIKTTKKFGGPPLIHLWLYLTQGCPQYFPTPVSLSEIFSGAGTIALFCPQGAQLQDFRHELPEKGAEGSVLENFCDFSKKLFLKNAIKSKIWVYEVRKFFRKVI